MFIASHADTKFTVWGNAGVTEIFRIHPPDCNQATKRDDEYFRICVTAGARPGTHLSRLWRSKVMGKTFARSPGAPREDMLGTMRALKAHHTAEPLEILDGRRLTEREVENVIGLEMRRVNARRRRG